MVLAVFLAFGNIMTLPFLGMISLWIYLELLPLPLALNATFLVTRYNDDNSKIITAMGNNIITVLGADLHCRCFSDVKRGIGKWEH